MHIFSQDAASNSLFIMLQGIKVSASPCMNSVGVEERFTASTGAARFRSYPALTIAILRKMGRSISEEIGGFSFKVL